MSNINQIETPDGEVYDINATTVNGHTVEKDVPADAVFRYSVKSAEINSVNKLSDVAVDDITAWDTGSATSVSYSNGAMVVTNGTVPSLSYTAKTVPTYTISKKKVVTKVEEPNPNAYYGMIIHQAVSNPTANIEYIGINQNYSPMTPNFTTGAVNYGDWADMPTIAENKPAMIKTDGTFGYWLDESDYSKKEDGTVSDVANINYDGNAFAWFEPIWMKITESGTDLDVRFAYSQLDSGYYEVCPQDCGVWLPMYYGSPDSSGKMRSIANTSVLGGKTNNTSTDVQNTAIKRNGNDYYFLGGKLLDCISLLQMMWFKTTNSDNICRGNQDGYDSTDTTTYGTKVNPIVGGGQFYCTNDGKTANKILHCLPLGTYDVWLRNPYIICDNGTYKVSKDYTFDSTGATYTNTGKTSPSGNGYQKELTYIDGFGLVPKSVGASTSTYYSDYYYINSSIVAVALSFGRCNGGRFAGFRSLSCNAAAGYSYWGNGCALFLKQSR